MLQTLDFDVCVNTVYRMKERFFQVAEVQDDFEAC